MSADRAAMDRGALVALSKARSRYPEGAALLSRSIGILRCANGLPGRGRRDLLRALRAYPTDTLAWAWLARAVFGVQLVRLVGRRLR
jgi:predicted Zn-dependent protease